MNKIYTLILGLLVSCVSQEDKSAKSFANYFKAYGISNLGEHGIHFQNKDNIIFEETPAWFTSDGYYFGLISKGENSLKYMNIDTSDQILINKHKDGVIYFMYFKNPSERLYLKPYMVK